MLFGLEAQTTQTGKATLLWTVLLAVFSSTFGYGQALLHIAAPGDQSMLDVGGVASNGKTFTVR